MAATPLTGFTLMEALLLIQVILWVATIGLVLAALLYTLTHHGTENKRKNIHHHERQ